MTKAGNLYYVAMYRALYLSQCVSIADSVPRFLVVNAIRVAGFLSLGLAGAANASIGLCTGDPASNLAVTGGGAPLSFVTAGGDGLTIAGGGGILEIDVGELGLNFSSEGGIGLACGGIGCFGAGDFAVVGAGDVTLSTDFATVYTFNSEGTTTIAGEGD